MSLPQSWSGESTEVELNGDTIRLTGVTFEQYQSVLHEAVRRGATGSEEFCELVEEMTSGGAEVVGRGPL